MKHLNLCILLASLCIAQLVSAKEESTFDLETFGKLPVQKDGRVKPLDTVARNALLLMRGKQTALLEDGYDTKKAIKIPATQWLIDVAFHPEKADNYKTFRVDNSEVLAMFGFRPGKEKYFSFNDLFKRDQELAYDAEMSEVFGQFRELSLIKEQMEENSPELEQVEQEIQRLRERYQVAFDAKEKLLRRNRDIDTQFRHIRMGEDINGNGKIDPGEDANGNGKLDGYEDINGNGLLDEGEDLNQNGVLDYGEDLNRDGVLELGEDLNGNGILDPGPNSKKYTTYQNQAMKLYGALSLYDQLKSGLVMSLTLPLYGERYEGYLEAAQKLDAAIHQIEAEGANSIQAMESIQHALLLARDEIEQFGESITREQYDQVLFKYRVAMRAARNNANIDSAQLSDDQVNSIFQSIQNYIEMYEQFQRAKTIAGRNSRFSVLGIVPPKVAQGKAFLKVGDDIVRGTGTKFTQDFNAEEQFRVGQQGVWDGIWRDAAIRDKMVEEVISDSEMRLNYAHAGRNPLIDISYYLMVFGICYMLWKRNPKPVAPVVTALVLVVPWIICFSHWGADREDVYLHATHWDNLGEELTSAAHSGKMDPVAMNYAKMAEAYQTNNHSEFNALVQTQAKIFEDLVPKMEFDLRSVNFEYTFNNAQFFYRSMTLYVLVFICVLISWLTSKPKMFNRAAFWLMLFAMVLHTVGLMARIWIQARPPVTNLYSSAIFIGWGAVVLAFVFERIHKNGISSAAGSIVGFVTLIIAHHLSMEGDTMEMMQAVLDTNLWLATHVVVITLGYTAMFLAGILGIVFILRGIIDPTFEKDSAKSISSMVYGVTCFAVLFSFVGTMLGGIWADQSWGRFWGWDPKENGALLIVIWSAIVLHARWAGLVKDRGIMVLSIFGNIVTGWSWFGTNLLQEGLHSYGFSEAGFKWLMIFVGSQVVLMLLAYIPRAVWRSPWAKSAIA